MLTPDTLAHLSQLVCPQCKSPLGRFHTYPVTDPSTLITQLTEHAPHCWTCAEALCETNAGGLCVLYQVRVGANMASGRLMRTTPEAESLCLHLFSPHKVFFRVVEHRPQATITYPATLAQIYPYLEPAIAARAAAATTTDERRNIAVQLAIILARADFAPTPTPPTDPE